MLLKQWKTLEKCRKLGDAGGFCFVRDNYLYSGNNYAAVRLHNADMLTGAAIDENAQISVGSYPKKSSESVNIIYGDRVENLLGIDKVFALKYNEMSRCVNPDYLKMMMDVAKAFSWLVHIKGVEDAIHGCFVTKSGAIQGDFVIMGVRLK